jgi:hypothetical protein
MPRPFIEIISLEAIRRWAAANVKDDGRPLLARTVLEALEKGGPAEAEKAFFGPLTDYFYNLSATEKRRHADSIALSFCDTEEDAAELFAVMKERGVTGRTRVAPRY